MNDTIVHRFLQNLDRVHFTFDHGNGHSREYPGTQLAAEAAGLAQHFIGMGVEPGDRIAVVVPTSEPLLRTIVAAWMCRAAIVVLPHRLGGARSASSPERLQGMLLKVAPRVTVAYRDVAQTVNEALGEGQHCLMAETLHEIPAGALDEVRMPEPGDLAVLQFSSGSTRDPKAVVLTHDKVLQNTMAGADGAGLNPFGPETMCSWLPIYHDFGLVTSFLGPIARGYRSVLLPTEAFVSQPACWLQAISKYEATGSAMPPFAFDLLISNGRRISPGVVNLSSWRYAYVAAEPIFMPRLRAFNAAFAPHGLSPTTLRPAYGLAEAVVGVTVSRPDQPLRSLWLCRSAYREGRIRRIDPSDGINDAMEICACGEPIEGMEVRIADVDGQPVPPDRRGRIWIRGASVTEGYWGDPQSPLKDGWLDTGDEGFIDEGQLYVCGRTKDTLIRGGVNYDAHDIEDAVLRALAEQAPELRCRAAAVFAVRDPARQREDVVAAVELRQAPEDLRGLFQALRKRVLDATGLGLDDLAIALPPGLPRTTSGKLRRSAAREMYELGEFTTL